MRRAAVAALVLTAACATGYQPSATTGGFAERRLAPDAWRVRFSGNGYTSRETAQVYWLYRSAELADASGYDGFEVVDAAILAPVKRGMLSADPGHPLLESEIRLLRKPFDPVPLRVYEAGALKAALAKPISEGRCVTVEGIDRYCPEQPVYRK